MKRILVGIVVLMLMAGNAFAISMAGGYKSSGLVSTDVHVTTQPSKVFAITVTPSSNSGYAEIVETDGVGNDLKVLVYAMGATAGNTVHLVYPEGVNCAGALKVNAVNSCVTLQYKDN